MINQNIKSILKPSPFNPVKPDAANLVQSGDRPRTQPPVVAAKMAADSLNLSACANAAYLGGLGGGDLPPASISLPNEKGPLDKIKQVLATVTGAGKPPVKGGEKPPALGLSALQNWIDFCNKHGYAPFG